MKQAKLKQFLCLLLTSLLCLTGCSITITIDGPDSTDLTILTSDSVNSSEHTSKNDTNEEINQTNDTTSLNSNAESNPNVNSGDSSCITLADIPAYSGEAYIAINNNNPFFTQDEITTQSYEFYSDLDSLGRCGVTMACIGQDLMPTQARGSISSVKPTGWINHKYDSVDGGYLYNRCHLIGYQLTAENANKQNLITGTRYLNVEGMLPFENMTADYIKETNNHVMYRVTPIFDGDNLLADGVLMEGWSVEDEGDGICFNVFCYNVQPGIEIDYATGENWLAEENDVAIIGTYVLNTNTKKIHLPNCSSISDIRDEYREEYTGDAQNLLSQGYEACKRCKPLEQ
ncbi:MAG: DNA/RNA non-specific endonuclease [Lachnospiraceae bacterium]